MFDVFVLSVADPIENPKEFKVHGITFWEPKNRTRGNPKCGCRKYVMTFGE